MTRAKRTASKKVEDLEDGDVVWVRADGGIGSLFQVVVGQPDYTRLMEKRNGVVVDEPDA